MSLVVNTDVQKCRSPHCCYEGGEIGPEAGFCCVEHYKHGSDERLDEIKHIFHSLCFATVMCESSDFLINGKIIKCPVCDRELDVDFTILSRIDLARKAFIYHVQNKNVDAAEKILSSGLISNEFKKKVFQQIPEFAKLSQESHSAKPGLSSVLDQTAVAPIKPVPLSSSSSQSVCPNYARMEKLIKMKHIEDPSISARELQRYAENISGDKYSLTSILRMLKSSV